MKPRYSLFLVIIALITAAPIVAQDAQGSTSSPFYMGVDLSYVNEMVDCGAVYRVDGEARDPYEIFYDYGANLVRFRLWHTPTWTEYSTFDDIVRSLQHADALGMNVLLDFHYSDTWADPSKQIIPAAWEDLEDVNELGDELYTYTYDVLMELDSLGLMPEIVQIGNEINSEILRPEGTAGTPINWERNALLLNQAIRAVRDADAQSDESPQIMIHVAQPENVEGWLLAAQREGVTDFDIIGLSYYTGWSDHSVETVGNVISRLHYRFDKEVMIAETAYPWTMAGMSESAGNIPNDEFVEDAYPATPDGQRQFLIDLTQTVLASGGVGIVYWEPAWVSTSCRTLWGQGSHWENATFFDFNNDNEVLPAIEYLRYEYTQPVEVTLSFSFEGEAELPEEIFFWGDFTGQGRRLLPLTLQNGEYALQTRLLPGTEIRYQFYVSQPAEIGSALLPQDCMDDEGYLSTIVATNSVIIGHTSSSCPAQSDAD